MKLVAGEQISQPSVCFLQGTQRRWFKLVVRSSYARSLGIFCVYISGMLPPSAGGLSEILLK